MFTRRLVGAAVAAQRANLLRLYSTGRGGAGKPQTFVSRILDNLKSELSKNKEMKDNISKFREEAEKLEQSDALKQARRKFEVIESEAGRSSQVIKESVDIAKDKLSEAVKQLGETELAKKASEVGSELGKQAQSVASTMADASAKVASTPPFRAMSGAAAVVKEEIAETQIGDRIYRPPKKLRMRIDSAAAAENIAPNMEATGMELHKDSKFYQSWENFKESNPYVNRMMDWKIKYEESDNTVIKASRLLTNKVSEIMGGLFQRTELSDTLTEIMTIDPSFNKDRFLLECEKDIIPNILEAMCRGELEILADWTYEAAYSVMSQPFKTAKEQGVKIESRILDISQVDLAMGRVLEQGPVLVITFITQQISCVRDAKGKVVEGDPEKILRVNHAWVLCRDRTELNAAAGWRLLELSASASEQFL